MYAIIFFLIIRIFYRKVHKENAKFTKFSYKFWEIGGGSPAALHRALEAGTFCGSVSSPVRYLRKFIARRIYQFVQTNRW